MNVLVKHTGQKLAYEGPLASLFLKVNLRREETVFKVNGKLVPESKIVTKDDLVEVIKVVFGG